MRHTIVLLALLAACCSKDSTGSAPVQIQLMAENRTSDSLIVWWWWKDVLSADIPGDPIMLGPNAGFSRCVTFTPVAWAQIDAGEGTHDRNSSAGDWRGNLVTIDPARTSYWIARASGPGQKPSVSEQPSKIC